MTRHLAHAPWILCLSMLPSCQPGIIGEAPGTPDSGAVDANPSMADAMTSSADASAQPDAAPTPDAPGPPPCVDGDDRVLDPTTGHCYIAFYSPLDWEAARAQCNAIGAHLVDVTSAAENELVLGLAGDLDAWMGHNDRAQEGVWVWLNDTSLSYTNWRAGEPNNSTGADPVNGEDCGILEGARAGTWDDRPCAVRMYNFVCERD